MASPLNILIVDKTATLKSLSVKEFNESDLYKKCGFKQPDKFEKRNTWNVKYPSGSTGKRYHVSLFAKNIENDPGLQRFLAGIQQLEVHNGQLKVLLNK